MKNFLATFVICLILCYIFLLFGGAIILESFWAAFVLVALIIAVLVTVLIHQESKLEELEGRIKALESPEETQE